MTSNLKRFTAGVVTALLLVVAIPLFSQSRTVPAPPMPAPRPQLAVDGAIEAMKPGEFLWAPDIAPQGPVTMIISLKTQRAYAYRNGVLRNGIEIGSSAIKIDGPVTETMAFTLRAADASGYHWLRLPLPGQWPATAGELTPVERARVNMPEAFRLNIAGALQPGTTLLVTRESLASGGTGKRMTFLTSDEK